MCRDGFAAVGKCAHRLCAPGGRFQAPRRAQPIQPQSRSSKAALAACPRSPAATAPCRRVNVSTWAFAALALFMVSTLASWIEVTGYSRSEAIPAAFLSLGHAAQPRGQKGIGHLAAAVLHDNEFRADQHVECPFD